MDKNKYIEILSWFTYLKNLKSFQEAPEPKKESINLLANIDYKKEYQESFKWMDFLSKNMFDHMPKTDICNTCGSQTVPIQQQNSLGNGRSNRVLFPQQQGEIRIPKSNCNSFPDAKERPKFNQKPVIAKQQQRCCQKPCNDEYSEHSIYNKLASDINEAIFVATENIKDEKNKEKLMEIIANCKANPLSIKKIAEFYFRKNKIYNQNKAYMFEVYCRIALLIGETNQRAISTEIDEAKKNSILKKEREEWTSPEIAVAMAAYFQYNNKKRSSAYNYNSKKELSNYNQTQYLEGFYNSFVGLCSEIKKRRSGFSILRKIKRELGFTKDSPCCQK